MRRLIGVFFLLLQLVMVVHARLVPSRWLSWAPNDYAVAYQLEVTVSGRALSPQQIEDRYLIPAHHIYQNPAENIMDMVRQYEQTYGRNDHARVVLHYSVSGKEWKEWRWPPE